MTPYGVYLEFFSLNYTSKKQYNYMTCCLVALKHYKTDFLVKLFAFSFSFMLRILI